jgi:prolyl-tRNA synthetase
MLQSFLPQFARKESPKDEESYNAQILVRAGFVEKVMAGVYAFLPLGLRVLKNIERIVREEMNALGAHEILMPVLGPKDQWQKTGRWESLDVLFKVIARDKKEYALGPTHEEIVVPIGQKAIFSYRDLPFGLYQIQTKFRDEPRAKSGLLRGREFLMKDLYSFHASVEDLELYYARALDAYKKIFARLGLNALQVEASGGSFSKYSHEFQVLTPSGEDEIIHCDSCAFAQNREINENKKGDVCPRCGGSLMVSAGSEVGNIFQLKTKYSTPFGLSYTDESGNQQEVQMGCYGIGISRLMGVIAELYNDEKGLIWPETVAPFKVHTIALTGTDEKQNTIILSRARFIYDTLVAQGIEVLYDDRTNISAGQKFAESDLFGIPLRIVISQKTGEKVEIKKRNETKTELVDENEITRYIS